MTLKRKSLIRAKTHFFWYTLALVLSMAYILRAKGIFYFLAILGVFFIKVKTNMNKYVMWAAFTIGYYTLVPILTEKFAGIYGVGSAGEL